MTTGITITRFSGRGRFEGSAQLADVAREAVGEITDDFVRTFAQEIANEIQVGGAVSPGTPIDTGFARANWDAALGAEAAGGTAGGDESPDPAAAEQRVLDAILRMRAGDVLFMRNTAPYARRLEFGHSQQAPAGFVGLTLAAAPQIARDVADFLRGRP